MAESWFYSNLTSHLASAGILAPNVWAPLYSQASPALKEALPELPPASIDDLRARLNESRPPLKDLEAWIAGAAAHLSPESRGALDQAWLRVRGESWKQSWLRPMAAPGLVVDTRPLEVGELLGFQREIIDSAHQWARDIREHIQRHPSPTAPLPSDPPMPVLETHRVQRILLLDGERGTGKTALLLSMVDAWRREATRTVLPVALLDFDPRPSGVGTYPWLLTAFRALARWLDEQRPGKSPGRDAHWTSLRAAWEELHRKALLGWNRTDGASSREDRVADAREADAGWSELRVSWLRFMDDLARHAEERAGLARNGLLMVGIDDLDLNERNVRDLLGALRLLSHPRLIVILTGDHHRLQKVLARELLREVAVGLPNEVASIAASIPQPDVGEDDGLYSGLAGQGRRPVRRVPQRTTLTVGPHRGASDELDLPHLKQDAHRLAAALLKKAIPIRLPVTKLTTREALQLAASLTDGRKPDAENEHTLTGWLYSAFALPPRGEMKTLDPLGRLVNRTIQWLDDSSRGARLPERCLTVRAVTLAAHRGRPAQEVVWELLDEATDEDGEPLLKPFRDLSSDPDVGMTPRAVAPGGQGNLFTAGMLSAWLPSHPDLRVPELAEFALRLKWPWGGPEWQSVEESPVVSTRLRVLGVSVQIGWPTPKLYLDLELAEALARQVPTDQDPETMLRFWIQHWLNHDRGVSTPLESVPPQLAPLLAHLATRIEQSGHLRRWALHALPLLAAPEHGLSDDSVNILLDFTRQVCRERGEDWQRHSDGWDDRRRKNLARLLGGEADTALKELRSRYPMALWYVRELGRQWYLLHTPRGQEVRSLYEQLNQFSSPEGALSGLDLFSMAENRSGRLHRHPLWSASVLTRFLAEGTRAREFLTALDSIKTTARERAPLPYFLQPWRTLCVLAGLPELADLVRLTDTAESIELLGPPIVLKPRLEGFDADIPDVTLLRVVGWTAWRMGEQLPWPAALVGWLGQLQTILWRTAHPSDEAARQQIKVEPPAVFATMGEPPPLPERYDWLDCERLRLSWDLTLNGLAQRQDESPKARKRYLFVNWVQAVLSTRVDNTWRDRPWHEAVVSEQQGTQLVSQLFSHQPVRLEIRRWLVDLRVDHLIDAELAASWKSAIQRSKVAAKLSWDKAREQLAHMAASNQPQLHQLLRNRQDTQKLIDFLAAKLHKTIEWNDLKALLEHGTLTRLQEWVELGG